MAQIYQHFLSKHWEIYDLDTMKLSLGGREYTDQEDDGHVEGVKGSQKQLKHVAIILMVEQVHYSPLGKVDESCTNSFSLKPFT